MSHEAQSFLGASAGWDEGFPVYNVCGYLSDEVVKEDS